MESATYSALLRNNQNFRRLWAGQVISELGTWFSAIAELGLVRMLSGSTMMTAALLVARTLPFLLVSPLAGVAVDRGQRKRILIGPRDVLRLSKELGRDTHHQGGSARASEQLGINLADRVHRNVLHVLQATNHLHIFGFGDDGVGRLVQRLQRTAAPAVDRRPGDGEGQPSHQAHRPAYVQPLLLFREGTAQHEVIDLFRIDAGAFDDRLHHAGGEIIAANIAEPALVLVGTADGSTGTGNDDGTFHVRRPYL